MIILKQFGYEYNIDVDGIDKTKKGYKLLIQVVTKRIVRLLN